MVVRHRVHGVVQGDGDGDGGGGVEGFIRGFGFPTGSIDGFDRFPDDAAAAAAHRRHGRRERVDPVASVAPAFLFSSSAPAYSSACLFERDLRVGQRGDEIIVDGMYQDGFQCPLADMLMGETAEKLAKQLGIGREEQDEYARETQARAGEAMEAGRFQDEVVEVEVSGRKGSTFVDKDEHVRPGTTMEQLGKLPPVFDRDAGTVTAGNASGITDGAAVLLLMSEDAARDRQLEPLAYVGETRDAGVDPSVMGLGPVPAVRALSEANGLSVGDYDLVELNEAFAAQVLACDRELAIPRDRLNVNGGAIALGHPIGATGARIVITLLHELRRRDGEHGLATLCISGGMGIATAFHRTPPA